MIGRLLGIDHGLVRIGLAVSDALGLTARELVILKRRTNAEDYARINNIAAEQQVVAFIVGVPYNDNDDSNPNAQSRKVKNWARRFAETTPLPILYWDEQLTSADAAELAKTKRRKVTDHVDDLAARLILQSYLDALRDGLAPPPTTTEATPFVREPPPDADASIETPLEE